MSAEDHMTAEHIIERGELLTMIQRLYMALEFEHDYRQSAKLREEAAALLKREGRTVE